MADVLVVLEQRDGEVKRVSHEALGAAAGIAGALGGAVHALLIGPEGVQPDAPAAASVFHAAAADLERYQPAQYTAAAAARVRAGDYAAVILAATALGKDLAPRIAARLGCPLATDVVSLEHNGGIVIRRPVYAGKAISTWKITETPCVVSVRPNIFEPAQGDTPTGVEPSEVPAMDGLVATTLEVKHPDKDRPDVAEASVIVSGGRGLKGPEHFGMIEELADALGAAVGASRAVVDAGWRPHAEQVGQTGKTVSPTLYIAVAISGAVQHLAGMRTAKTIVAINKDKDAPIFKVADYGIVGDAFEIVPKLTEAVKQVKGG